MATEAAIKRVLDLLTLAPLSRVEALSFGASGGVRSMRRVIADRNVIGVGISEKISDHTPTGKLALTFYVERKVALRSITADLAVPPTVPEALSGPEAIACDVIAIGKIRPEPNIRRTPIQPGYSIGHVDSTAGTFGALVAKGKKIFLLSNSHVLALSGTASRGDPIVFPGPADGGSMPGDQLGKLAAFKKFITGGGFDNHVDCAIAKPLAARESELVSAVKDLGVPKGTIKPVRGMKIVKVGRTTDKTFGEVRDVNFRFVLDYDEVGAVGFIDQVFCTRYSRPGDSGSLILDRASGKAVGLHFAGADGGSVFNPIGDVLSALGVTLVTSQIGSPQARPVKKKAAKKKSATRAKKRATKKAAKKKSKRKAARS